MGYIKHHAIVVTGSDLIQTENHRQIAIALFGDSVTNIVPSKINGDYTFFIGPDGSKEGWKESDEGNDRRDKFIRHLEALNNGDYCEFFYGEDNGNAQIERHN